MEETESMTSVIRSVAEGKPKTFPLTGANVASWRAKAGRLNQCDGYRHYSVAVNTALGIIGIVNNGEKFKNV